jgi:hypothetical protein
MAIVREARPPHKTGIIYQIHSCRSIFSNKWQQFLVRERRNQYRGVEKRRASLPYLDHRKPNRAYGICSALYPNILRKKMGNQLATNESIVTAVT